MNVLSDCKITIKMSEHGKYFVFFIVSGAYIMYGHGFYGRREGCGATIH